jgi:hypothetical protein
VGHDAHVPVGAEEMKRAGGCERERDQPEAGSRPPGRRSRRRRSRRRSGGQRASIAAGATQPKSPCDSPKPVWIELRRRLDQFAAMDCLSLMTALPWVHRCGSGPVSGGRSLRSLLDSELVA